MKRLALVALAAAGLTLAACGDDEVSTVTETVATEAEATTETLSAASGPKGELTTTGIGEAQRGMSTGEVQELFGQPDRTQTGPGCELAPQSKGALAWTYRLDGGEVILNFDAASGELGFYRNTSPGLETTLGDKVGDPFASLKANWGGRSRAATARHRAHAEGRILDREGRR